jgi:hypothetical protein
MSIPQPQMLYTGLNVPVPDWKSFNKEFNARMDMIRREKQQQRQYEQQRQDQLNREFLQTVDVDKMNYANANLQQKAANIYQTFDDVATNIVSDKGGNISMQDTLKVKALRSRAEQELTKYKSWDTNHQKDVIAASDPKNAGKFDMEAAREDVFNWDGDTPYTGSRLKLQTLTPGEYADKLGAEYKDANKRTVIMKAAGLGDVEGKTDQELTKSFVDKLYDVSYDDKGFATLNLKKDKAIQEVKEMGLSQDFRLGDIGMMKAFDAEVSDVDKQFYVAEAKKVTGKEEDARYLWFIDKYMQDEYPSTVKDLRERESSTASKNFSINFGGKKITDNLTNSTSVEYGDVELDNFYPVGEVKVKLGKSQPIKGARVEQEDGTLGNAGDIKVNNAEVVGVNMKDGFVESVVYSAPSTQYVYKIGSGANSMSAETLDELAVMTGASVEDLQKIAKKTKESGKPMTIVAPAYGNESTFQKSFAIDGSVGKTRKPQEVESFDDATEQKINAFMAKNNIKDRDQAIGILKQNNIIK